MAIAGAFVAIGQVALWFRSGAWPPHDSVNIWLAGMRLREGEPVYTGAVGEFLVFVYSPPIAVLSAIASHIPVEALCITLLLAQVLALRFVAGSWIALGLLCWLPVVPRAFVTGNVDFVVAAAIYGAVLGMRTSGWWAATFAFMKFSPALAVRRWREFAMASAFLLLLTFPWLDLWPAWIRTMSESLGVSTDGLLILPRVPVVILLLLRRRPWATAGAAALATPAFYFHSWVLAIPALRLWWDDGGSARTQRALERIRDGVTH